MTIIFILFAVIECKFESTRAQCRETYGAARVVSQVDSFGVYASGREFTFGCKYGGEVLATGVKATCGRNLIARCYGPDYGACEYNPIAAGKKPGCQCVIQNCHTPSNVLQLYLSPAVDFIASEHHL